MRNTRPDPWRPFGGAFDAFDFGRLSPLGAAAPAQAPAGFLSPAADDAPLAVQRVAGEMARLADDAYKKSADDPVADGWHALTADELGIRSKGSGEVRYSFADGVYRGDTANSSEGQALVLSRTLDSGERILTLAFRGTVDLYNQFADYFPFDKHYKNFRPLIAAVKDFVADDSNGIDKVMVTGHSLGGAMAQLFMNEELAAPASGYTFGSPGADKARKEAKLVNFAHENDLVPWLGSFKDDRSGGIVTIDKNGLDGITAPHAIERYVKTTEFLAGEARDADGPFYAHGFAATLRTGDSYGRDIRLEIGSNQRDVLKPFAEDRFSLAGDASDRFAMRRGELAAKGDRDLDGGLGRDSVSLPYNKFRSGDGLIFKVIEQDDGGLLLKYDAGIFTRDVWKTVGMFYRTETVIYANGKEEPFAPTAKPAGAAEDGNLLSV
jgi:hypothetical protein